MEVKPEGFFEGTEGWGRNGILLNADLKEDMSQVLPRQGVCLGLSQPMSYRSMVQKSG